MSDHYILVDKEPVAVDFIAWAEWFEKHNDEKIIARDEWGGLLVSTVFLGLDHSFGSGPPILFETMVFMGSASDLECERYETYWDAVKGHIEMCNKVFNEEYKKGVVSNEE